MNPSEISKRTLPLLAAAILAAAASMPARAVDCTAPSGIDQVRGCAAAKQGPEALRHYVERTRMIHNLYYWDYAPYAGGANVSKEDSQAKPAALALNK
jgi:hypothetical protein